MNIRDVSWQTPALSVARHRRPLGLPGWSGRVGYVPPAMSTTPNSATTTPTRCTPRTRSPSSAAASSTVVTGYSELATATVDSSPSVVETL